MSAITGSIGAALGTGPGVTEERTITASPSGGDKSTLVAALLAAAALVPAPSSANRALIQIFPGTYNEDNPLIAIPFVDMVAVGKPYDVIITPVTPTAVIFEAAPNMYLCGVTLRGASGAGGVGYRIASGTSARVVGVNIEDCETGFLATGAGVVLVLNGGFVRRTGVGEVLDIAYRSDSGAAMSATSCQARGSAGAPITSGFYTTDAGSVLHLIACQARVCTNGMHVEASAQLLSTAAHIHSCTNARRAGPAASGLIRTMGTEGLGNTTFLLVDGATSDVDFISDQGNIADVILLSDTTVSGDLSSLMTDNAVAVRTVLSTLTGIGIPERSSVLAVGMGVANNVDMLFFQFDDSAGSGSKFTDVTEAAQSREGSTVSFPGTTQTTDALLMGFPVKPWGLNTNIVTAMTVDGVVTWEFWDGATWVEMPPGGSRGSGVTVHGPIGTGSVYRSNLAFEVMEPGQHVLFNDEIDGTWVTAPAAGVLDEVPPAPVAYFWIRFRMSTLPATQPIFQQFNGVFTHVVSSVGGSIWHGKARTRETFVLFTNTFVGAGSVPGSQDIAYSSNVIIGFAQNSFAANALDRVGITFEPPLSMDGSTPLQLEIEWMGSDTDLGDVEWQVFYVVVRPDDVLATVLPGALTEFSDFVLSAGPGVIGEGVVSAHTIRIPNLNMELGDSLALLIQRDGRGSNPNDTYTGAAIIRRLSLNFSVWRKGKALS